MSETISHFEPGIASPGRRIAAVVLRYWYLLRGSWPRLFEIAYWPTIQMVIWGLITLHLTGDSSWVTQAAGVLIGAVLLWDVLFRGQLGASLCFLEEMWSRNMGHLFVSPLRPHEWVASLVIMSLIRTLIGVLPAAVLAIFLYDYNIFSLGLPLAAFFANLMVCSWWMSLLIIAMILRFGLGAEGLAWLVVFLFAPVSAIYYPVSVLPEFFQWVALALPPAHVFEGMRGVLFGEPFSWGHLAAAVGLNGLYGALAGTIFLIAFKDARRRGALLNQGE
ncbi:MAG: ABC transporter permease [Alphaproteobacteria bacterium]|jgi:ABC-2 type transport system permease protein|nr:ABC transporter permease [Alphaproteobacteria bacterium]